MLDSARWRIAILGSNGFYAKTIQRNVRRYTGEKYSLSTIYKTLKEEGVKIRAYRDGTSPEAKSRMAALGVTKKGKKTG